MHLRRRTMDVVTLKSISIVFHRSLRTLFCANIFELHYMPNWTDDGDNVPARTMPGWQSVLMIVISEITRCDKNNRSNECENNCLTEIRSSHFHSDAGPTRRMPNGNRCFSTLRNTSSRVYIFQHFMEIFRPYFDLTSTLSLSNAIENSGRYARTATPTPTFKSQNGLWPYAMHTTGLFYFLLLLLSPVKCQTFCYFPNDCRQFLIVFCSLNTHQCAESANIFAMIYFCRSEKLLRIRMTSTYTQHSIASSGVFLCAFKESLKLFIIFNTKTGKISPWKCLFLRGLGACGHHMLRTESETMSVSA